MRYSNHPLARWVGIAALLLILPTAHAAGFNDTGITTCSDARSAELECPVLRYPGQDAEYGRDAEVAAGTLTKIGGGNAGFDFTKLDAAGNELPATATNHVCVRDNITGLIWEVKTSDKGLHDKDWTYSWYDATAPGADLDTTNRGTCYKAGRCDTEIFIQDVNTTRLCGFNDWRMPTVQELINILDYGRGDYDPKIDANYFPNTSSSAFWSGTYSGEDYAWNLGFGKYGYVNTNSRRSSYGIRLVHGGQSVDAFVDNGDGTVMQTNSELMWAKCSEGQTDAGCTGTATQMIWNEALNAANNSRLGGYSDWRLPNIKELQLLTDYSVTGYNTVKVNSIYFPNTPTGYGKNYLSGSPYSSSYVWAVDFSSGETNNNSSGIVRFVRGGQSSGASEPFDLTVTRKGAGAVTSTDGKINCGSVCSASFVNGSSVTLTATADTGYIFSGWSGGGCSGTGTCAVNMTAAQTVKATFTVAPVTYSLSISKVGNGSVSSDPSGINCGSACAAKFASGKVVTLTAKPDTGATFVSWSGCTAVAANPLQCTLNMSKASAVTATFATIPTSGNLTVKTVGNGTVISAPVGITCGTNCKASFDSGAVITLTATPATGETFTNWSGCTPASSTPNQCRVTLTDSKTVTATFSTKTTLAADVRVMGIVITPALPSANSPFTAAITVKNIGNITMDSGALEVWVDQPTSQACKAAGDAWDNIGQLTAGESKTLTIRLRSTDAGAKRLRIFADSQCVAAESNETNNQSVKRYAIK